MRITTVLRTAAARTILVRLAHPAVSALRALTTTVDVGLVAVLLLVAAARAHPVSTRVLGAVGGDLAIAIGRTRRAGAPAAVDIGLRPVEHAVLARPQGGTLVHPAKGALAVEPAVASLAVRALRTERAATIDVGLVLVLQAVVAADALLVVA
jgi:hypothetical protein